MPRVLAVRELPPALAQEAPGGPQVSHRRVAVLVGGDILLLGMAPGFSGWASYVAMIIDMGFGIPAGISAGATLDRLLDGQGIGEPLTPTDDWSTVQPTNRCTELPSASRSPRLSQNCNSRQFAIVPAVCGSIQPICEHVELALDDNVFVPAEIEVPGGTKITWVNYGHNVHTLAGPGWGEAVEMNPGDSWTVTYTMPIGDLEYRCTIHPEMRLRLTINQP